MGPIEQLVDTPKIAYLSMEIGLRSEIPTYSGGLGVLAGDTIRACADLNLPVVGVTLVCRQGYFHQELDAQGRQHARPDPWDPARVMSLLPPRVRVTIDGRPVVIGAWLYAVDSPTGGRVPVLLLDTEFPDNAPEHRELTSFLYGRDTAYRLRQEIVLGIGGGKMLEALGVIVRKYHMNEGHSALLTLELLERFRKPIESVWDETLVWDVERIKDLCVFTTHTPVEAGHDRFPYDLVERVLGTSLPIPVLKRFAGEDMLNMTLLGLNLSRFVNGVAKKHGEVSRALFPGYEISAITNGVHSFTWTCPELAALYDAHLPGWANDPELLVRVDNIPDEALWSAHQEAKGRLITLVKQKTGQVMDPNVFTIGYARRMTPYKRADLLFSDLARLAKIGDGGRFQVVLAGKAHPQDQPGQAMIERLFAAIESLRGRVTVAYVQDYDMAMALTIIAGSDVWLNTPRRPHEASGTSGMKAAHNGVPNFSVLDGWWIEGHIEGITGWAIGPSPKESTLGETDDARDAHDLYEKLEQVLLPCYQDRPRWTAVMKHAIGKNASYFNCHRMMRRYVTEAYLV